MIIPVVAAAIAVEGPACCGSRPSGGGSTPRRAAADRWLVVLGCVVVAEASFGVAAAPAWLRRRSFPRASGLRSILSLATVPSSPSGPPLARHGQYKTVLLWRVLPPNWRACSQRIDLKSLVMPQQLCQGQTKDLPSPRGNRDNAVFIVLCGNLCRRHP